MPPTAQVYRRIGSAILALALTASVAIFAFAPAEESPGILGLDVATKSQRLQMERMGGKTFLLFDQLTDWFGSLWHGRRLAFTIGLLGVGAFVWSRRLADNAEFALRGTRPSEQG